jgi:hypothetical protein
MSEFSATHKYHQPERTISFDEIEELVSELQDDKIRYLEILTERIYTRMQQNHAPNFGMQSAREIVLRLFVKTNGAILE